MSYVTNSEADTYFESRYNSDLWNTITEDIKTKLIATATRYLEALNWAGCKNDENQVLEFPRGADTTVPQDIKDACCEIAYALLDGRDVETERELLGQSSSGAAGSRVANDPDIVDVARLHNIPSAVAWNKIRPYLRDGSVVTLSRVD